MSSHRIDKLVLLQGLLDGFAVSFPVLFSPVSFVFLDTKEMSKKVYDIYGRKNSVFLSVME